MPIGVRFTKESAKRIASAVRTVEASPIDLVPFRRRSRAETGEGGDPFPCKKCSFGYKINPDGDNPVEVMIYSGKVDLNKDDIVVTGYQSVDTKVLISETTTVWVRCRVMPTGLGDPWPTRDIFVETRRGTSGLTYWVSYLLYTFVEAGGVIDGTQTQIHRFLDIERDGYGDTLPVGTEAEPHLVWDSVEEEWVKGVVVPPGSEAYPHLVWNVAEGIWEKDKLLTLTDGGDVYCVAIWSPLEGAWTAMDMLATPYKVLQNDDGGNPIMDYVRWT